MQKWAHTLVSIAGAAVGISTPSVQAAAAGHPKAVIVGMALWAILGHLLPPPVGWLAKLFGP
jgi:hypothetical protein